MFSSTYLPGLLTMDIVMNTISLCSILCVLKGSYNINTDRRVFYLVVECEWSAFWSLQRIEINFSNLVSTWLWVFFLTEYGVGIIKVPECQIFTLSLFLRRVVLYLTLDLKFILFNVLRKLKTFHYQFQKLIQIDLEGIDFWVRKP